MDIFYEMKTLNRYSLNTITNLESINLAIPFLEPIKLVSIILEIILSELVLSI